MTDEPTEAEVAAIRQRMMQPLSREEIVANELQLHLYCDGRDLSQWDDDDWLGLARHMIKCVEVARDISADEMAKAMNAPWTGPLLPTIEELGD